MTQPIPYLPFFVYGTLLPGQPNYAVWREAIVALRPAEIGDCRLYDLGHYPMLVASPGGVVRGMVVAVARAEYGRIVAALDYLEGIDAAAHVGRDVSAYRRVRRVVRLAGGHTAVAWVYLGHTTFVEGLEPIAGDWKAYVRHRQHEVERWWQGVASILERPLRAPSEGRDGA